VIVKGSTGCVLVAVKDDKTEKLAEDVIVADNVILGAVIVEVDVCVGREVNVLLAEYVAE
jgi:hypothetical protein